MDYYYYDQITDNELESNEDYDYDSLILPEDESFVDVYERCIKSSTQQVQQYIIVLLGCSFSQRIAWELVRHTWANKHKYLYHLISSFCGIISLWFYVGVSNSFYVLLHVLNLCLFLKVTCKLRLKYNGPLLCFYTIVCQLFFEYLLKSEQYETIRGPQMVVGMKLISVAFEVQDEKQNYQYITFFGYLLSPGSLILGPWIPLKDYLPDYNVKVKLNMQLLKIFLNIFYAVTFLILSNCILPWLKQLVDGGVWLSTYLDALSVRCSHYFVCYLSQATLLSSTKKSLSFSASSLTPTQSMVNPLAIEFPRSLSDVIRSWNIPMHLWLKQNVFNRLRSAKYSYFTAILLTYAVSCLVHGLNLKVHLVLISLSCFSFFENRLRHCLAQVFDACIDSTACKQNCKYSNCPRKFGLSYTFNTLLVRLVNFLFSSIVVIQLAYLGVILNNLTPTMSLATIFHTWSNLNYVGHILAVVLFVFYKCI